LQKDSAIINRRIRFQAVFLPSEKVVGAVTGSGMHDSRTLIKFDVIGKHCRHDSVEKRVLEAQTGIHEKLACVRSKGFPRRLAAYGLPNGVLKLVSDDFHVTVGFDSRIFKIRRNS